MNKNIVFGLVVCLLLVAAVAENDEKFGWAAHRRFHNHHHHHHHQHPQHHGMPNNALAANILKTVGVKAPESVHPEANHMPHAGKRFAQRDSSYRTTLEPNVLYEKSIEWGNFFSIPYSEDDNIAVQIVRTSDSFSFEESPKLRFCQFKKKGCKEFSADEDISFEISAEDLAKNGKYLNYFMFTLSTEGFSTAAGGVSVALYACVGKNASLATCNSEDFTKECIHGTRSSVIDVCVCDKGYTGSVCDEETAAAPEWDYDSDIEAIAEAICEIISVICTFFFLVTIIVILCSCCVILRHCCCRAHQKNGRVCQRAAPPPPYPAGSYHPLNVVPPPPPPPMEQGQHYNVYNGNAIEMSTLPAAKVANPVFIMPPLAPVKQVPVFIQPPSAPKN